VIIGQNYWSDYVFFMNRYRARQTLSYWHWYAYRFPGLIRVLQSAGRVIRSDTDKGVIVLLDRRFQQIDNIRHLPSHWQINHCQQLENLQNSLNTFWDSTEAIGTD
jgi:Rad3-related DNA helicase